MVDDPFSTKDLSLPGQNATLQAKLHFCLRGRNELPK